jgi:hypothetical protein
LPQSREAQLLNFGSKAGASDGLTGEAGPPQSRALATLRNRGR